MTKSQRRLWASVFGIVRTLDDLQMTKEIFSRVREAAENAFTEEEAALNETAAVLDGIKAESAPDCLKCVHPCGRYVVCDPEKLPAFMPPLAERTGRLLRTLAERELERNTLLSILFEIGSETFDEESAARIEREILQ